MIYLTVPILVESSEQAVADISRAAELGAEMVELRIDYLCRYDGDVVRAVVGAAKKLGLAVLATCRANWEGGKFGQGEKSRAMMFKAAVRAGADYIDIELACRAEGEIKAAELAAEGDVRVILSSHDFEKRPADLAQRVAVMVERGADVAKVAYKAERICDCFDAIDIYRSESQAGRQAIALAMGEAGVMTRQLAKKLGGKLTFAALGEGLGSAAGQVTIEQMRSLYRWDAMGADTQVFGVIGDPVGHSLSPALHNAAFDATGYNGIYLPLLVEGTWEEFRNFMDGTRQRPWLGLRGLSVTIPHKENALRYVRENGGQLEPLAEKIGSVNTLLIDEAGKVSGFNTDYAGALGAVLDGAGLVKSDLKGMSAAIIGAGGVARALAAGLCDAGAEVTIYNRTVERAEKLAEDFGCKWAGVEGLANLEAKLIVNCTSLGMHPAVEGCAVPEGVLTKDMIVFDTVYNPVETRLLKLARSVGATVVDGVSMFVRQGAAQFEMFTGRPAPLEVMREIFDSRQ